MEITGKIIKLKSSLFNFKLQHTFKINLKLERKYSTHGLRSLCVDEASSNKLKEKKSVIYIYRSKPIDNKENLPKLFLDILTNLRNRGTVY